VRLLPSVTRDSPALYGIQLCRQLVCRPRCPWMEGRAEFVFAGSVDLLLTDFRIRLLLLPHSSARDETTPSTQVGSARAHLIARLTCTGRANGGARWSLHFFFGVAVPGLRPPRRRRRFARICTPNCLREESLHHRHRSACHIRRSSRRRRLALRNTSNSMRRRGDRHRQHRASTRTSRQPRP